MRGERGTRFFAQAGDDVQRAVRQARFGGQLGEAQRRQAGVFGGLEHRRVAHRQRRRNRSADHLRRVVPRDDVRGHAQWLAQQRHVVPVQERDHFAVDLVGRSAIELKVARQHDDVVACGGQRLAGVARFDLRQLVDMVEQHRADLRQDAAALGTRHPAPGAVIERMAGRGHGQVDLVRGTARDLVVGFSVGR